MITKMKNQTFVVLKILQKTLQLLNSKILNAMF